MRDDRLKELADPEWRKLLAKRQLEYLAVCRSFQLLTLHARGDAAKAFEILVLLPRSPLVVLVR